MVLAVSFLRNHIYFFGLGCIDVDECLDDIIYNEYCGANTLCTNTIGSFYCGCLPGYHRWVAGEGVNKFTTLIANYFLLTFSFFLIKELTYYYITLLSAKKFVHSARAAARVTRRTLAPAPMTPAYWLLAPGSSPATRTQRLNTAIMSSPTGTSGEQSFGKSLNVDRT